MARDKYIIGQGFAPEWCRRFLMAYKRADGTTGYLFYGRWRDFELVKGDTLLMDDGKIKVRKRGQRGEEA